MLTFWRCGRNEKEKSASRDLGPAKALGEVAKVSGARPGLSLILSH